MNNIGPITEPYGMLWMLGSIGMISYMMIFTEDFLDEIKDINQLWTWPVTPISLILMEIIIIFIF